VWAVAVGGGEVSMRRHQGIEAPRHQGTEQRKGIRKEEESYPQITQIGRRLFKRIFKRKRRGRVLFEWFVEYFCFGVYEGWGESQSRKRFLAARVFFGEVWVLGDYWVGWVVEMVCPTEVGAIWGGGGEVGCGKLVGWFFLVFVVGVGK